MSARNLPQTPIERAKDCLKDWERNSFCLWDSRSYVELMYVELIRDLLKEMEK